MKKFTPFEETIKAFEDTFEKWNKKEFVGLMQSHSRVLARDIIALDDFPKNSTSSMDGYAIRYKDQSLGRLKIKSSLPAGSDATMSVNEGECIKTFTGSLMSDGSDTLIPIENVEVDGDYIRINEQVTKNFSVRPRGESYKKGDILIKKGTTINYAQIATLAELGVVHVEVYVRPNVAILATGDEIVDIGECITRESQIRSSNHVAIASICKEVGANPILLGVAKDDKELIKKKILQALEVADIVVTTGGVSVGDYDFVRDILGEIELKHIVKGSAIKPGRHIKIAKVGQKYILALPGFPYSSIVGFYLYGVRLIEYWLDIDFSRRFCEATIDEDYKKRSNFKEFSACNFDEKTLHVDLKDKAKGSSAIVNNLLNKAVLLCVDMDTKIIKKGEKVEIFKLNSYM